MQTGPEYLQHESQRSCYEDQGATDLMAKLVVAALKLGIWNPDGDARAQLAHPQIDAVAQIRAELVRAISKRANPEFLSETVLDAVDGILEATVAVRVRRGVPGMEPIATKGRVAIARTS